MKLHLISLNQDLESHDNPETKIHLDGQIVATRHLLSVATDETAEALPESIQRAVDLGISGIDIMHGELKIMMLVAEQELANAQAIEDETEEAMDSMERKYWEGQLDALVELYRLTYDISFAIGARNEA